MRHHASVDAALSALTADWVHRVGHNSYPVIADLVLLGLLGHGDTIEVLLINVALLGD